MDHIMTSKSLWGHMVFSMVLFWWNLRWVYTYTVKFSIKYAQKYLLLLAQVIFYHSKLSDIATEHTYSLQVVLLHYLYVCFYFYQMAY